MLLFPCICFGNHRCYQVINNNIFSCLKLFLSLMILLMTGLSILALLGKNTTTTVKQKFHNGKNQKSGLKENRDKKKQTRWQLIASRKIEITEER
uniref:Uncharacterized protein n=1 Tax=Oryctolagus cuniculus TaxID=9986 RepID=U3KN45_RABIT